MAITVNEVNIKKDYDLRVVSKLMTVNFGPDLTPERTSWLYRDGHFGPALAFILVNDEEPIGIAGAFPRKFINGKDIKEVYVLGDFAIDQRFRALGPAVQLQRALLKTLEERSATWYDFPSLQMQAVYSRLRVTSVLTLSRWTYPISAPIGSGFSADLSKRLSRLAFHPRRLFNGYARGFALTKTVAEEIPWEKLSRTSAAQLGFLCDRQPGYLDWRYQRNDAAGAELFLLKDSYGTIRGYTACRTVNGRLLLLDCIADAEAFPSLLAAACELAYDRKFEAVDCILPDQHRVQYVLKKAGFFKRESSAFFTGGPMKDANWFVMDGDRES